MLFDCTQLPGDIKLNYFDKENNMQEISIEELTKGKKVNGPSASTCSLCVVFSGFPASGNPCFAECSTCAFS